jgi:putative endonuclease
MCPDNTTPDLTASGAADWNTLVRQAEQHLRSAGLRILDRNLRCPGGQIDILAADQQVLVACEVRARSDGAHQTWPPAMSRAKRARLRRLAVCWLVAHGLLFDEVRVDVICLHRDPSGPLSIEHVRGVG